MKNLFFVTPIGAEGSIERRDSDFVMNTFLTPVAGKLGYSITRADKLTSVSRIDTDIVNQLDNAEMVIIDATGPNPNVMFEFGYRYAKDLPFIVMTQKLDSLPFDVQSIRTIPYTVIAPDIETTKDTIERMILDAEQQKTESKSHGYNMGETITMNALATGDMSQINNLKAMADAIGLDLTK